MGRFALAHMPRAATLLKESVDRFHLVSRQRPLSRDTIFCAWHQIDLVSDALLGWEFQWDLIWKDIPELPQELEKRALTERIPSLGVKALLFGRLMRFRYGMVDHTTEVAVLSASGGRVLCTSAPSWVGKSIDHTRRIGTFVNPFVVWLGTTINEPILKIGITIDQTIGITLMVIHFIEWRHGSMASGAKRRLGNHRFK